MMLNYIHAFNSYSVAPVGAAAGLTPDMGIVALRWQLDF
jgi:hypothetical protein